jgi:hypothetical protein
LAPPAVFTGESTSAAVSTAAMRVSALDPEAPVVATVVVVVDVLVVDEVVLLGTVVVVVVVVPPVVVVDGMVVVVVDDRVALACFAVFFLCRWRLGVVVVVVGGGDCPLSTP